MNRSIKIFLILAGIAFSSLAQAQYLPKPLDTLVKNLKLKGVDTILVYMNGSTWHNAKCDCLKSDVIYAAHLIYQLKGKTYTMDFSCCKENETAKISKSISIPYFISLNETLKNERIFFSNDFKKYKRFPPPIPTDQSFESVELIMPKQHLEFGLNSYQSGEGYSTWKKYPWINKEISLIKLIRQDLMLNPQ